MTDRAAINSKLSSGASSQGADVATAAMQSVRGGWTRVPFGDVSEIVAPQVDPTDPRFADLPHVSGENIESGTCRLTRVKTAAEDRMISGKYLFEPGDVLYSKLRPYLRKVAVPDFRGVCSADMYPLRVRREFLDPHFAAWMLVSEEFTKYAIEESTRARMPKLNRDQLFAWKAPLPPLPEQRRIATILGQQIEALDRALAAAKAQMSAVDALPAAYLRAVFHSSLAKAWPTRGIGEVAKVQSGFAFKSEWFAANGIRLLRNANVFQGYVAWDDEVRLPIERRGEFREHELSVGDIVLSLDRPVVSNGLKVARLTAADVPALLLQRVGRFRLSGSADPDYVYAFLNSKTFIAAITQHDYSLAVPHVSPKQVEAVAIPLPPLPEQRRISAILRDQMAGVERSRKALREQLDAINALPAALLRRAFSGEL